jgi:hypothetical protein
LIAPFPLGRIVATPGALKLLEEAGENPLCYLSRHVWGDWGEIDKHDRQENERSLKHGWRILSSYPVRGKTITSRKSGGPFRQNLLCLRAAERHTPSARAYRPGLY